MHQHPYLSGRLLCCRGRPFWHTTRGARKRRRSSLHLAQEVAAHAPAWADNRRTRKSGHGNGYGTRRGIPTYTARTHRKLQDFCTINVLDLILGIVEGLTEFLPVSSTAHLRISEALLHIHLDDPFWKMYSIVIQLGVNPCVRNIFSRTHCALSVDVPCTVSATWSTGLCSSAPLP